jgi:hypothetical protein
MTDPKLGEQQNPARRATRYLVKLFVYSSPVLSLLVVAALVGCGVFLLYISQSRQERPPPTLASSIEFGISGSDRNLTPGVPELLPIVVHNPFSVALALVSITVTEAPTPSVPVVPPSCPGAELALVEGAHKVSFVGRTARATWNFASAHPVLAADSSSHVLLLSVLLTRSAGNQCQNVTFPFVYTATAVPTTSSATTIPGEPSTTQPVSVPTQASSPPGQSPAAVAAPTSGPLPVTGTEVAELVCGAAALLLAGFLIVLLARRQHLGDVE